ncbi:DDE-domain-containing protein, partial [Dendrothele bispora CBS 962.96]
MSIRGAAAEFNIPRSTLSDRARGKHKAPHQAHNGQLLLTAAQEAALVSWCHYLDLTGHPLTRRTIGPKVAKLSGTFPGKNWLPRFLERHRDKLFLGRTSKLDDQRGRNFNFHTVHEYFKKLDNFMQENEIPWVHVWNMDEKGVQMGGGRKNRGEKYILSRRGRREKKKTHYRASSSNLELVTVIESINAEGSIMKPGFVFSGKRLQKRWFTERISEEAGCIAVSDNGWTDDRLSLDWFKKTFVPEAEGKRIAGKPILLIWDGHGSHETMEIIDYAREHNIHFFSFPSHTTHKLQPLDVGVFGLIESNWGRRVDELAAEGRCITKNNFIETYLDVRKQSMTTESIVATFKKTGLNPINPDVFDDRDYGPSWHTSTQLHTPDDYPTT